MKQKTASVIGLLAGIGLLVTPTFVMAQNSPVDNPKVQTIESLMAQLIHLMVQLRMLQEQSDKTDKPIDAKPVEEKVEEVLKEVAPKPQAPKPQVRPGGINTVSA